MRVTNPVKGTRNLWESIIKPRMYSVLGALSSGVRQDSKKKNTLDQGADQADLSPTSEEGLIITDLLKRISEKQAGLAEDLGKRIIRTEILINIQKELRKEWNPQTGRSVASSQQDEITKITLDTVKKVDFYNDTFEEEDFHFTLRIGWKLAEYHLGLTQQLEDDEEYLTIKQELMKQMESISNENINNLLAAYLNFSFAINSAYILSSYISANPKVKRKMDENFSPGRIKEVRDKGLDSLLRYSQMAIDEVLKSGR